MRLALAGLNELKKFHYWITAILLAAVFPCLRRTGLPVRFDWIRLGGAYWIVLSCNAIFLAVTLYLVQFPKQTIAPILQRLIDEKLRILLWLAFFFILLWALTWRMAMVLTVDTVAALEFFQAIPVNQRRKVASRVFPPALYLFVGWLLVFAYNDIIVSVHFFAAKDATFNAADIRLLHGISVADISHWGVRVLPLFVLRLFEIIYYGMFSLLGAGLILISVSEGPSQGLRLVGTVMVPTYAALILFYLWTSQGPFYLDSKHFTEFPRVLKTYSLQLDSIEHARARWEHAPLDLISGDYFIAFPCMHISAPLIVTWFLRRWKKLLALLIAYDLLLTIGIVLLEWHYVVDIAAGILLAVASIIALNRNHKTPKHWLPEAAS